MNTTGVFLQVRLRSSRLPRKALLDIEGLSVIEHAMDALSRVKADVFALLTDSDSAPELKQPARRYGFDVYAGSPDDVLKRYAGAVRYYGVDRYMRATGDNPLVSSDLADSLLRFHEEEGADFSGYLGPPLGTGVEITESAAILTADLEADDPYEREHVSPFLYRRPKRFSIQRPWASEELCLPEAKVTLDTSEDYEYLKRIYRALYQGVPIEVYPLVQWLKGEMKQDESTEANHTPYTVGKTG